MFLITLFSKTSIDRSRVKDVKVITSKKVASQDCLLVLDVLFSKEIKRKKKSRKYLKLWSLKEPEVKQMFGVKVNERWDSYEDSGGLRRKLLDVAREVCGYTKDKLRHSEKRLWHSDVDVGVSGKRDLDLGACEIVEKVDSCRDGFESFRIAKQRADVTGVNLKMRYLELS